MSDIELKKLDKRIKRGSVFLFSLSSFLVGIALAHLMAAIEISISPILLVSIPILLIVGFSLIKNQKKLEELKKVI